MKVKGALIVSMLVMAVLLSGVAAANSVASITTDKREYAEGESVSITVVNNCRGPLVYNGYWVESAKGDRLYTSPVLDYTIILSPGESRAEVWGQNTDEGKEVGAGTYVIGIEQDSASVTILRSSEEVSTDKQTYVLGEVITVTIANTGEIRVPLNGYCVEDAKGNLVYSLPMPLFMQYIQPGQSYECHWDQTCEPGMATAGTYTIRTLGDSTAIEIIETPVLNVDTDKPNYHVGENVAITLMNDGAIPIVLTGYWIEDSKGNHIHAPPMPAFVQYLNPGASATFVWAQMDDSGNAVLPGTYTVHTNADSTELTIREQAVKVPKSMRHTTPDFESPRINAMIPVWLLGKVI